VDKKFTKKFGQARLKVAVLNPDLIPDLVDVVIGEYIYELQFRVEEGAGDDPQPIDMDAPFVEDNNEDMDKVNEEPMGEDGKQNETAPKQPPTNLPPSAGGAAGGLVVQHRRKQCKPM
jgi:hypothetical protein